MDDDAPRPLTEEERLADWMMFHLPEYNRWMMTGWRDTMRDEAVVLARQMLDAVRAPRSDHKHTLHDGPHPWRQCECEWTAQTVATPVSPSPDRTCDICGNVIVREAHGGIPPSAGDHDPAPHVARAYGGETPHA